MADSSQEYATWLRSWSGTVKVSSGLVGHPEGQRREERPWSWALARAGNSRPSGPVSTTGPSTVPAPATTPSLTGTVTSLATGPRPGTTLWTYRREVLGRTLIWNQTHLLGALRTLPPPIADPGQITRLDIRRRQRMGGILQEYQHVA